MPLMPSVKLGPEYISGTVDCILLIAITVNDIILSSYNNYNSIYTRVTISDEELLIGWNVPL